MKLAKTLKRQLLAFAIFTGIFDLIVNLLKPFMDRILPFLGRYMEMYNHQIVDASGKTMNVVKVNGNIYPPFGEYKFREIPKLRIRDDDVLLCGYPKTGCHWMYEIIFMLLHGKAELSRHGKELGGMIDFIPEILLDSLPSPRVLNSHLMYAQLPKEIVEKKTKIILTVRNPKDTVVSFYNHHIDLKSMYSYGGSFNDYFNLFMEGRLEYGDYFDYVLDWERTMKNQSFNQIHCVSFEDMKSAPLKCVLDVANFLKVKVTEQFAREIVDACSFNRMKKKRGKDGPPAKLFRKGMTLQKRYS